MGLAAGTYLFVITPLWWIIVTSLKDLAAITNGPTYLPFIDFQPVLSAWHDAVGRARSHRQ